jgi:hypothetical protein
MIPAASKDITASWLNEALHESGFLRKDTNITSIGYEPLGVGEGFVSDMARLSLDYDRDTHGLPRTIVAKLPTSFESAHAMAMLFNLYEKEIRFYREVAPQSPVRTPALVYADVDLEEKKYILLLEDCSCYQQVDQLQGLNHEQTRQVALMLADFHAYWWDAEDLYSFPWMPTNTGPVAWALVDAFRGYWDVSIQMPDFVAALPEGGYEAGAKLRESYQWLIETGPDDDLTISHFDFRVDNLFFDPGNSEHPVIVYDWQAFNINRGVVDLSYLLGGSLPIELRREIEEDIVRLYHDRLGEKGVSGYSWDECWQDYLKGTLTYAYIPVLAYATLDTSDPRGKQLASLLTTRHFTAIVDNDATSLLP